MTDPRHGRRRDAHSLVDAWLIGGASGELPRDLAVHASLCAQCQASIAAFDMLGAVDLDRAGFPPARVAATQRGMRRGVAVAAGGVVALSAVAAVAAGGWRLVPGPGLGGGTASDGPTQEVLGNTGQPQASSEVEIGSSASPRPSSSATPAASAPSAGSPPPIAQPTLVPATARPTASPGASHAPSPTPRPSIVRSATPVPSPSPSDSPQPPTPTPEQTVEETPAAVIPAA
jgi:hypothetical protein